METGIAVILSPGEPWPGRNIHVGLINETASHLFVAVLSVLSSMQVYKYCAVCLVCLPSATLARARHVKVTAVGILFCLWTSTWLKQEWRHLLLPQRLKMISPTLSNIEFSRQKSTTTTSHKETLQATPLLIIICPLFCPARIHFLFRAFNLSIHSCGFFVLESFLFRKITTAYTTPCPALANGGTQLMRNRRIQMLRPNLLSSSLQKQFENC